MWSFIRNIRHNDTTTMTVPLSSPPLPVVPSNNEDNNKENVLMTDNNFIPIPALVHVQEEQNPSLVPCLRNLYLVNMDAWSGLLGSGAYGRVYRAARMLPNNPENDDDNDDDNVMDFSVYACKCLPLSNVEKTEQARRIYDNECQAFAVLMDTSSSSLSNAINDEYPRSLVQCFATGRQRIDNALYGLLILEQLPAHSLHDLVYTLATKRDTLGPDLVFHYGRQLTDALVYLHSRGVAHRDLKCENVALHIQSQSVVLYDLGFARIITPPNKRLIRNDNCASPMYMAPEQNPNLPNQWVDPFACDIWQLGQMFFKLMTGRALFQSCKSLPGLLHQLNVVKPDAVSAGRGIISANASYVQVMRATLHYDPAKRLSASGVLQLVKNGAYQHPRVVVVPSPKTESPSASSKHVMEESSFTDSVEEEEQEEEEEEEDAMII